MAVFVANESYAEGSLFGAASCTQPTPLPLIPAIWLLKDIHHKKHSKLEAAT